MNESNANIGHRAQSYIKMAKRKLRDSGNSLAYLSQPARHAFLCREAVYLLASQHDPVPAEVYSELMDRLVALYNDEDL